MDVTFRALDPEKLGSAKGVVAVLAYQGEGLGAAGSALDEACGGALQRAMAAGDFSGKAGQLTEVMGIGGIGAGRVLIAGLGERGKADALVYEAAGGHVAKTVLTSEKTLTIAVETLDDDAEISSAEIAAHMAYGATLGTYRFDRYRTKQEESAKPKLEKLAIHVKGHTKAKNTFADLEAVAQGVILARDLVNEPANILGPEEFANRIKELTEHGITVEILGEKEMKKLGMGSLLGVGQGSVRESKLAIMQWNGARRKTAAPLAFVGKGVCFDTGGISLKPSGGMEEMTMDMGGAAAVTGLMKALALRQAKCNAVGIVGLVENMPDGNAQRPGDVVTSMSGQTIEVLNTDAEGRLVLADALWYCQDRFKPKFMVDLATLTGAIIVALGHENAGIFSNNDDLANRTMEAGRKEGEGCWRLPLSENYNKKLKSRVADMANIGGRDGGSIVAAQFIQRFVNDVPWVHMDIAGTAYVKEDQPTTPKHGTGFGVRVLNRLVADYYED